ncbi:hypothetical protein COU54_05035 [Candidatus Pacearchaeota archaeon CG10_big_fil_rev_8_21_14_0_10_31_24]|nr:MAG: hypothetical protein COU54_05035 [Candidatus Pacearchaeota archaeon CG10_big_fil_rev_8_21_14_0_10_31_24]
MKKNLLICIDRDNTLIYDNKYFLGRTLDWKSKIKILKGVVQGLKKLRTLEKKRNLKIHMITNQSGIAIADFPLLNTKRAEYVCKHILNLLKSKGAKLDGFSMCEFVTQSYVERHPQYNFDPKHVGDYACTKPRTGMVKDSLKKSNFKLKDTQIYVLGDRASDVKTALNIKGFGILIPKYPELAEVKKTKALKSEHTYIAKDFLGAVNFIVKRES